MRFSIISDVHVKHPNDNSYKLLISFLKNEYVSQANKVFLLGDIFDLMIGFHREYLIKYKVFFNEIANLIKKKITVHYFAGNHDFHLKSLFLSFLKDYDLDQSFFRYHETEWRYEINGKKFHLSHGDDIEIGNLNYKIYKYFISSLLIKIIVNHVIPFKLVNSIGTRASASSRKINESHYADKESKEKLKKKFRKSAEKKWNKKKYDYLICGHSHIKDFYKSSNNFYYLNNGHALESKTFIHIDDNGPSFIAL